MSPGLVKQLIENKSIVGGTFRGRCWVVTLHQGDYDDYTVSVLKVFARRELAQELVDFGDRLIKIIQKWQEYFYNKYDEMKNSMPEQDFRQFHHDRLYEQEERRMRKLNKIAGSLGLYISKWSPSWFVLEEKELI